VRIINKTKNTVLAQKASFADTPFKRMKGLLARKELEPAEGLILKPCQSIHTFFMRFAIDVVFVDRDNRIIKTISGLKPWRLSSICFPAQSCIELPEGTIASSLSSPGDFLSFSD